MALQGQPLLALVIDDDAATRRLLRLALAPYGFEVAEAGNGQEALRHLESHRPDVIVLDLEMPVMDGWSFLREVDVTVPIFVLSVSDSRRAATEFGASGWMRKPFDPDALGETLAAMARRQSQ